MSQKIPRRSMLLGMAGAAGAFAPRCVAAESADGYSEPSLIRTYQGDLLLHVSPDGKWLCVRRSAQPFETFFLQLGEVLRIGDGPESELVIIEALTGREIFAQKWAGDIAWASFFPDGKRLYAHISRQKSGQPPRFSHLLIDLDSGQVSEQEAPASTSTYLEAATNQTLIGIMREEGNPNRGALLEISLPDYAITREIPLEGTRLAGWTVSQDRTSFAYVLGRHRMVVRRSVDLEVIWEDVLSSEQFPNGDVINSSSLSANGAFYALSATAEARSQTSYSGAETRVYHVESGELVSQLPIPCFYTTAVSPDGSLLARGIPRFDEAHGERVVDVEVYDTSSRQRVAVLEQDRWRPTGRSGEGLRPGFTGIYFTPDGRHLIASTIDTHVWSMQL